MAGAHPIQRVELQDLRPAPGAFGTGAEAAYLEPSPAPAGGAGVQDRDGRDWVVESIITPCCTGFFVLISTGFTAPASCCWRWAASTRWRCSYKPTGSSIKF